jgi:hypothetical protein
MTIDQISAVVVTKGDRDISPVLGSLKGFGEVTTWNNSKQTDCHVLGRFVGALAARNELLYVQDDDCIVDAEALAAQYQPGEILCNMPLDRRAEYRETGITLIGWGCIFPKLALGSLVRFIMQYPADALFRRECDRVFTYLNRDRIRHVEVPFRQLPYAHGMDRMGREDRHRADFLEIRRRLATL